ncbi:MAG: 4Fe-4S binding protein [Planctomycetota bacterium]|jgi:polyferredoxin
MAKGKDKTVASRLSRWRSGVQASFSVAWLAWFIPWLRVHTFCSPVFHCHSCPVALFACPIGMLAHFGALHAIPYVTIGLLTVVGVLVGSFVCGWACPFGFLQDLIGRIPTPKLELPAWMGLFRYVVLVSLVLAVPYAFGENHPLFFCRVCPAGALEAAVPFTVSTAVGGEQIIWPSVTKTIILVLFLVAMFFTWRPWCTLFCPLGAIFGLFNRVSIVFMRFHPDRCSDCDVCRKLCHYHASGERRGSELRCIRCLRCARCRGKAITVDTVFAEFEPPDGAASPSEVGQS